MAYLIDEKMRGYIIRYTLKIGPDYVRKQKRRKKRSRRRPCEPSWLA